MSKSTIAQKVHYIREINGFIECYIEQKDGFAFLWAEPECKADKKLERLTMVYHIEGKGIYDGIYTCNGSLENLAFLMMLKIVHRIGNKRSLSKLAPPDKARADIFLSLHRDGLVSFYKGSSGFLNKVNVYTEKEFRTVVKHYTHAYRTDGIGIYLRNNHLVRMTQEKINNDARIKQPLTITEECVIV